MRLGLARTATFVVAFALCALFAAAAPLRPIKVGIPGLSIGYGPFFVAQAKGFFARNGLDASFVFLSDDTLPAALVSNGIQVTPLAGSIVSGSLAGFPVKCVGILSSKLAYVVVAKDAVTSLAGLKGKRIISAPPKSAPNLVMRYLLIKAALNPDTDVELLHIGSVAARQTLMENGGADAIIDDLKSGLTLETETPGLHILVPSSKMPVQAGTGVGVSEATIQNDPQLVTQLLRALSEADDFIRAQPAEAAPILAKELKMPSSVSLEVTHGLVDVLAPSLVPSPAVFANEAEIRSLGSDKPITAAQVASAWDTRLAAGLQGKRH